MKQEQVVSVRKKFNPAEAFSHARKGSGKRTNKVSDNISCTGNKNTSFYI